MEDTLLKAAAGAVHGKAVFDRRTRVLSGMIERLLPPDSTVLDVGTGDGRIASLWQRARPDLTVEGIDVLVRGSTHIPVRPFDGRTIPSPDKSQDVVTFIDVLHHTDDAGALLAEAARVARKLVVIKDHLSENVVDHATLRFMDWVGNAPHGVVLPYNYFPRARWDAELSRAGLKVVTFDTNVPLYPFPLNLVFGRRLHFIASLRPDGAAAVEPAA
jgi:SAM-dependent methyltransferase